MLYLHYCTTSSGGGANQNLIYTSIWDVNRLVYITNNNSDDQETHTKELVK